VRPIDGTKIEPGKFPPPVGGQGAFYIEQAIAAALAGKIAGW